MRTHIYLLLFLTTMSCTNKDEKVVDILLLTKLEELRNEISFRNHDENLKNEIIPIINNFENEIKTSTSFDKTITLLYDE